MANLNSSNFQLDPDDWSSAMIKGMCLILHRVNQRTHYKRELF